MKDDVVIVGAARTAVGSFNGAFASTPAHELGATAIKAALERSGVEAGRVSEVIMGQILTAAQGQNPARQASIKAGVPMGSPAWIVNMVCGSGLRSVALGYQAIMNGDSDIVVAGGQESMTLSPHAQYLRGGHKMGSLEFVDADEYIKSGVTVDSISKLRPAFDKDGTVTAASASGINDGGAAVVLMRASQAAKEGRKPLARIASWAQAGVDASIMGSGPIPASRKALEKAGWKHADLDLVEANEAFAAQACAVNKDLGWDTSKVNVNGGAIAIGHPIGASGTRIRVTLLHEMNRRDAKKGLATLCIGGGMGIAMCVER